MGIAGAKTSYYPLTGHALMPQEEMLETGRRKKQLVIGIPKEVSKFENRIALTPQGVELLVNHGHQVLFESTAGENASYNDHAFSEAGARITTDKKSVFDAEIILKIAPPTPEEIELLKSDQLLISLFFPFIQTRESVQNLLDKRINAIAFEFLRDENNCNQVIRSMSEIEGAAAIMIASEYLSKAHNGKGVLLGGVTGISPSEIVILGAGTASEYAARAALGLGATVKVFDNSYHNLKELEHNIGQRLFTSILHPHVLTKALHSADAVLGNLHYQQSPINFMVTDEQVAQMKKGAVIIDLSMGHGGCFESSHCTDLEHPVFIKHGVIHYCVPNIASRVSRTATIALSNIFAPLLLRLADAGGMNSFLKEDVGISHGTYIYKGILTNSQIGKNFNLPSKDIGLLMAAF
jgi:alanine dehydrogenase